MSKNYQKGMHNLCEEMCQKLAKQKLGRKSIWLHGFCIGIDIACVVYVCILCKKNCKTCAKKEVCTWTFCGSKILLILGIPLLILGGSSQLGSPIYKPILSRRKRSPWLWITYPSPRITPPSVSEGCPASPFSTFIQDVMFGEDEFSNICELMFG